jgi:ornithine cyclodeaminase
VSRAGGTGSDQSREGFPDAVGRVLGHADVVRALDPDRLIDALVPAFVAVSDGTASVPPRVAAQVGAVGWLGAMVGYVPGVGLGAKLVSVFPHNHEADLPSHHALVALFDEQTGALLCVMDGMAITALRTAAGAALATRLLARQDARVLTILGAGVQGQSHLDLLPRVRDFAEIRIASRNPDRARALAGSRPGCIAVSTFEEAVRGADVVACCTDAREPVLRREWLADGVHVNSVGGTFGPELDADTVATARVFVEWRGVVSHRPPAGAHDLQGVDPEKVTELGELLSGRRPGRCGAAELTVYKSVGHAAEDVVAARLVYDRLRADRPT